jgi:hypothetical protein
MSLRSLLAGTTALLAVSSAALAQHDHAAHAGHAMVGQVKFANSCAPAVQDRLAQGVAMLHSFWWGAGEQTFRNVLAKDPGCALCGNRRTITAL